MGDNIMTICLYYEDLSRSGYGKGILPHLSDYKDDEKWFEHVFQQESNANPSLTKEAFINQFSINFSQSTFDPVYDELMKYWWPCKAYERNDVDDTYTVRIYQSPIYEDTEWTLNKSFRFVKNLPRKMIYFVNEPYKSDYFIEGVFRHEIGIRDEIFPDAWKNLKK